MLVLATMEKIRNGWLVHLTFNSKRRDETWFSTTPEKALRRIERALSGQNDDSSEQSDSGDS